MIDPSTVNKKVAPRAIFFFFFKKKKKKKLQGNNRPLQRPNHPYPDCGKGILTFFPFDSWGDLVLVPPLRGSFGLPRL